MYSSLLPLNAPYSCAFEPGLQTIVHPLSNALSSILLTLFGIVTLLRSVFDPNALAAMLSTVLSARVDGIVSVVSVPVYPVISTVSRS